MTIGHNGIMSCDAKAIDTPIGYIVQIEGANTAWHRTAGETRVDDCEFMPLLIRSWSTLYQTEEDAQAAIERTHEYGRERKHGWVGRVLFRICAVFPAGYDPMGNKARQPHPMEYGDAGAP